MTRKDKTGGFQEFNPFVRWTRTCTGGCFIVKGEDILNSIWRWQFVY
jgi:hypothetical protein